MAKKKKAKKKTVVKKKRPAPKPKKKAAPRKAKKKSAKAVKKSPKKASSPKSKSSQPKKTVALAPLAPKAPPAIPGEKFIGEVEDYYGKISVVALTLKDSLAVGDSIHILGHTTDYVQTVDSMQINHDPVKAAKKGDGVGIKAADKSRKGDNVYRIG